MKIKIIDGLTALCSLGFFISACYMPDTNIKIIFCVCSGIVFFIYFFMMFKKRDERTSSKFTDNQSSGLGISTITELALLNDDDKQIAFWEMYGKASLVIGLDVGENKVDVNLINSTYASTIDIEHAVMNYSGNKWYLEDLGSENGVSVVKSDGKKYKITAMKPCLVEKGDIIYISLTKLKLC